MIAKRKIHSILLMLQFFFTFLLLSCDGNNQIKFDRRKWDKQEDPVFPSSYRSKMLTDLTTNYNLKGMKYSELIKLLGLPNHIDSNSLSYQIKVDYEKDIDPVYEKI